MTQNYAYAGTAASMPVANASVSTRLAFIRKTYTFFALTLAFAVGGAAFALKTPGVMQFFVQNHLVLWIALFASIFGIMFLRKVPVVNAVALFAFGAAIGMFASPYLFAVSLKNPQIIVNAFGMTCAVFGGLTSYVFLTRKDFSWMGGMLTTGFWILFAAAILFIFFPPSQTLHLVFLVVGTLIFSGYVLYDTSMIVHHLSEDEYIMGAINLFLDFYNLFMFILSLLSSRD